MSLKRIIASLMAVVVLTAFAGCSKNNKDNNSDVSNTETISENSGDETSQSQQTLGTERTPENVEDYAIFKYTSEIPEGYTAVEESKEGKLYVNGKAKIIVFARNYKEDYQELAVVADSACATFKMQNGLYHADTKFEEPIQTKVAGFDAYIYPYEIIAYQYEETDGSDKDAEPKKTETGRYKGEYVFFYSDEDVFYVQFESSANDYNEQLPAFTQYLKTINITKK